MKPQTVAHYEADVTAHDPEQSPFASKSCCRTATAFGPCTRDAISPHTNMSAKSGRDPKRLNVNPTHDTAYEVNG
jgi:hypothetical protein